MIYLFFPNLFKLGDIYVIEDCYGLLKRKVPIAMVRYLLQPFMAVDVWKALQEMSHTKTLDLDGFSALFYQKYWDVVGNDPTYYILQILNEQRDPTDFNYTYITPVPKFPVSSLLSHFCPISLCNVIMNLVTKCIANRLKFILPLLIDETQSAFVPGRLIINNALIAFEVFHYSKHRTKSRKGYMALKLDMAKRMTE